MLRDSKYIIRMKNYFMFPEHVCIVFELLSVNLNEFMKEWRALPLNVIKRIGAVVFQSCYLKLHGIIHWDFKLKIDWWTKPLHPVDYGLINLQFGELE